MKLNSWHSAPDATAEEVKSIGEKGLEYFRRARELKYKSDYYEYRRSMIFHQMIQLQLEMGETQLEPLINQAMDSIEIFIKTRKWRSGYLYKGHFLSHQQSVRWMRGESFDFSQALDAYQESLDLSPDFTAAILSIVEMYQTWAEMEKAMDGDVLTPLEKAEQWLSRVDQSKEHSKRDHQLNNHVLYAMAYLDLGEFAKADTHLNQATRLAKDPNADIVPVTQYYTALARLMQAKGNIDLTRHNFAIAKSQQPKLDDKRISLVLARADLYYHRAKFQIETNQNPQWDTIYEILEYHVARENPLAMLFQARFTLLHASVLHKEEGQELRQKARDLLSTAKHKNKNLRLPQDIPASSDI